MNLNTRILQSLARLAREVGPLIPALAKGKVTLESVEIYSLSPFDFGGQTPPSDQLGPYMSLEYFNDAAYRLCKEFQISVPPVIGKTTRAELPPRLSVMLTGRNYVRKT